MFIIFVNKKLNIFHSFQYSSSIETTKPLSIRFNISQQNFVNFIHQVCHSLSYGADTSLPFRTFYNKKASRSKHDTEKKLQLQHETII